MNRVLKMLDRVRRLPLASCIIILGFILLAAFAPQIAPHSPTLASLPHRLKPPFWLSGGSLDYPLGTDRLGRDILSRIVYGARTSLTVSATALVVGVGFGTAIGLISASLVGALRELLLRLTDAAIGFPMILIALLLVVALGPSNANVVIAISLVIWARFARVISNEASAVMKQDFIALAKVAGCSRARIIISHLLPNVLNTIMVLVSLNVGWVIIVEATLSFLGAGIPPPTPTWGNMVAAGREELINAWWIATFPSICITLVVLSFNLFGDWLRDALDPKLRQV